MDSGNEFMQNKGFIKFEGRRNMGLSPTFEAVILRIIITTPPPLLRVQEGAPCGQPAPSKEAGKQ